MVLSEHASQRILVHYFAGHKAPSIKKLLAAEGVSVSRVAIWKFLAKYKRTGTIARQEGSGRKSLLTRQILAIVEEQMLKDDETTAHQLHKILLEKGINVSQRSILRWRKRLGWTFRGSAYCQLIRQKNKEKRLQWAREHLNESEDGFADVIWSDESSIQCETHKRYCYRKKNCPPKRKPRYLCYELCCYAVYALCHKQLKRVCSTQSTDYCLFWPY